MCKYKEIKIGIKRLDFSKRGMMAVWAEQDIILDKGFTLSAGTAFSARVINHGDENPAESPLYIQNCHQGK